MKKYSVTWIIKTNNQAILERCTVFAENSNHAIELFKKAGNDYSLDHPKCHAFRISAKRVHEDFPVFAGNRVL